MTHIETWSGGFDRKASAQQVHCSSYYLLQDAVQLLQNIILEIHEQNFSNIEVN
jgi:hypothetical protein